MYRLCSESSGPCHPAVVLSLLLFVVAGCRHDPEPGPYPDTRQSDVVDDYHGTRVPDPYRWLETLDSDETKAWIEAQNAVSEPYLGALRAHRYFVNRMRALDAAVYPSVPQRRGNYWVTREYHPDGTSILVLSDSLSAPPRLQLDLSGLGPDSNAVVRAVRVSPNGRFVAYSVALGGADLTEVRIRELATARDLNDRIPGINLDAFYWTANSDGIVYARYLKPGSEADDGVDREGIIGLHNLGSPTTLDRVLHHSSSPEGDAIPIVQLSSDRRFVLMRDYLGFDSRVWIQDLRDAQQPRFDTVPLAWGNERIGQTVLIGSVGTTLYLHTNRAAANFQVVAVDGTNPSSWETVVPESSHLLQEAILAEDHIVTHYRRDVKSALILHRLDGTSLRDIDVPAVGSVFGLSGGPDAPVFTFGFDSYTHPAAAFRHDVTKNSTTLLETSDLDIDPSEYVTSQVFFASKDGTQVPMFITHRADRRSSEATPTLLFGYGSAGHVEEPIFNDEWFTWIEAGGILAVANIRGGGEYGETWRTAGTGANKQNSFDDFTAAAEYLISEGYTTSDQLAITGASDGGLLVGAVMTQRPDLFGAAMPVVGVLDLLRTSEFAYGPLYARWAGDPAIPEEFATLYELSPLHALRNGTCYPSTLITTAVNDDRVHPSQSYKFAARLQAAQGCDRPTLLRVYPTGGHHGGVDSEDRAQRSANILAFAAHHTGLEISN